MSELTERALAALEGKYELYRVHEDGNRFQIFDPFFALRYKTDPHARVALKAYADSCADDYPRLADDLYQALGLPGRRDA